MTEPIELPTEILCQILKYLSPNDLSRDRLVSKRWCATVDHHFASSFQFNFNANGARMAKFLQLAKKPDSFFRRITKFGFGIKTELKGSEDLDAHRKFFNEFGPRIKSLTLEKTLSWSHLLFLFEECNIHLKFLEDLVIALIPPAKILFHTPLTFLANLQHLKLMAAAFIPEYTLLQFLERFLEGGHSLKMFTLENEAYNGVVGRNEVRATSSFRNIFKSSHFRALRILSTMFPMRDLDLSALTVGVEGSNLEDLIIHLKKDVSVQVFSQFFSSHRHSLRQLECYNVRYELLENFPEMQRLESFKFSVPDRDSCKRIVSRLDVVRSLPNLRKLECWWFFPRRVYEQQICHPNLRALCLHFFPVGQELIHSFLEKIPNWFPGLTRLEVHHSTNFTLSPKHILDLQQESDCGKSLWT